MPAFTIYFPTGKHKLLEQLRKMKEHTAFSELVVECIEMHIMSIVQQRVKEHESKVEFWKNVAAGLEEDGRRRAGEEESKAAASLEEQEKEEKESEELREEGRKFVEGL